jgi:hypothetical protein
MAGAASHLFAVKRRWMDWSGRVVVEERYWLIIWPVGVVRSWVRGDELACCIPVREVV